MTNINEEQVKQWQYIPEQAFLYFPQGPEVREAKVGDEQKQWRKIFQNGEQYDKFEIQALAKLQQQLEKKKVKLDPWFDRANKLRFLQANKFKTSNAIESMEETTKWRATEYPVQIDEKITNMLNSGAFYFCGRDNKYRPIIVADIGKFDPEQVDEIPKTLVIIMEFMINNLMIPGQVENYILIMNLQQASLSLRSVIMKILSFTSNSYRGRLFASYLLSMPTIIKWGWNAIISKVVSQNTVKKIKISGQMSNQEMWSHISKDIIEQQYGGRMPNIFTSFWPPNKKLLLFVDRSKDQQNNLISPEQYKVLYEQGRLQNRKVLKKFVYEQAKKSVEQSRLKQSYKQLERDNHKPNPRYQQQKHEAKQQLKSSVTQSKIKMTLNETAKGTFLIRTQTPFIEGYHTIKTFFQMPQFEKICGSALGQ